MNPVVYYPMEEWPKGTNEGTYVLVDSAPAPIMVWPTWTNGWACDRAGRIWPCMNLHGSTVGDYVIVPDYPKMDNCQLSVSAWVWAMSFNQWVSIVSNWSASPSYHNFGQFFLGALDGVLYLTVKQSDGTEIGASERNGTVMPRGRWQHVAFVADGTMLRLYRNGVEVAASPCGRLAHEPTPKGLGIGCETDESSDGPLPQGPCLWYGRLDEIAIFQHALTVEQVRQLYSGSAAP